MKTATEHAEKVTRYIAHRKKLRENGHHLVQAWVNPETSDYLRQIEEKYPSLNRTQIIALALKWGATIACDAGTYR